MPSRIGSGWTVALNDLEGPEHRLWVSAYITERHLNEVQRGDRVLLRGLPRDFAYESSSLSAVRTLMERGVNVRTHRLLHAKVYVREVRPRPIAWIGSANLTSRGKSEGRASENLEAMSGPLLLEPEEMARLERWWNEAEPLTLHGLAKLAEATRAARDDDAIIRLVEAVGGVLALQVSFSRGFGSFAIPPSWFAAPTGASRRAWRGVGVSVPYSTSVAEESHQVVWRDARRAILDGLRNEVAEPIPQSRHRFVVAARYRGPLDEVLPRLNEMLASLGSTARIAAGADDFVVRASAVVQAQAEARGLAIAWSEVESELRRAFDDYEAFRAPSVAFGFSIPIGPQELGFDRAAESVRSTPLTLFAKDRRQQVAVLESRVAQVFAKHGRRAS